MNGVHAERVAIVTGAASGIGRATVELLAGAGASVVAMDLELDRFDWAEGNDRIATMAGDVTDEEANAAAVRTAIDHFGRLDAAIFNAGVPARGDLVTSALEAFDRTMAVNVRGVLLGIRAVVPTMRAGGAGRIVVTASTSGLGGDPDMWAYNTSKAAVINLVRSSALDLAADGIMVNAVCPGPTETGMTAAAMSHEIAYEGLRASIPAQRWGRPEEIAAVIGFLASPAASFITGTAIPVDGGVTANTGQFRPRQVSRA